MAKLLPNDDVPPDALRGYRVFVWWHDHPHPAHVHLGKGRRVSSWQIAPTIECLDEDGFSGADIREQRKLLVEHHEAIWRVWHEHWQARGQP